MTAAAMSFIHQAAVRRLDRIITLLEETPAGMTRQQLAKATSITPGSARLYLDALRGTATTARRIRIGDWLRQLEHRGNYTPVYFAGDEEDAPRPAPLTIAERTRRYRIKHRKENALG
jgi:hypothetical protein